MSVYNFRGTHGSGKSTLVKTFIDNFPWEPVGTDKKGRPENYVVTVPRVKKKVYIVGSYVTACGGCDGIQPYSLIWERVEKFMKLGHVFFEGALVSSSYGNIGRASEPYGDEFIFCFMDTPLNECVRRIRERREKRGDTRPFNAKITVQKFKNIRHNSIKQFNKAERKIVWIDHTRAYEQVLEMLRKK